MQGWNEVRQWRRERRSALIAARQALSPDERRRVQAAVVGLLLEHFPGLARSVLGLYWPIRGEIGLHGLVRRLLGQGASAALPVVVEKGRPLEFRAWRPGGWLERGVFEIPVPVERRIVRPSALLVPLVGFDPAGYRLGYGGGYYDRTLAVLDPRPFTIGVGFELGRLATIHPQPHDIPMDAIVTEAGVLEAGDCDAGCYASPPCLMHEVDPVYLGLEPDREDR